MLLPRALSGYPYRLIGQPPGSLKACILLVLLQSSQIALLLQDVFNTNDSSLVISRLVHPHSFYSCAKKEQVEKVHLQLQPLTFLMSPGLGSTFPYKNISDIFFLTCTEKTLATLPFHIIFKEWFSYLHQVTGLSSCQDSFTPKLLLEESYEVMKKLAGENRMWGLFSTNILYTNSLLGLKIKKSMEVSPSPMKPLTMVYELKRLFWCTLFPLLMYHFS